MTDIEKQKLLDLIKQAKEGKQAAFTKLYEKYKSTIRTTILQVVKNNDVADDLLSVTFHKAFSKIDSYINHISFEMWLKTIAINSSIDYIRRTKKENANIWIDDSDNVIQLSDTRESSPEDDFIYKETSDKVHNALSRLRYKYRNILQLRVEENLSYKEIGERLGLNESQVKSTLNKARKKLKQLLN